MTEAHTFPLRAIARVALLAAVAGSAHSQTATLAPVTVTEKAWPPAADVTGFGDLPLKDVPISASIIDHRLIEQSGARRLADLTRFDPSVADAYNAPGYWDFLSIRGFTLDQKYNYRREGLPISAETTIPLDNKERIELLKGTSGIQAGTSAPGGIVNYVVKRPTETDLREARLEWTQRSSVLAAVDLGGRFGTDGAFGYRLNVAQERLRPLVHNLDGDRSLFAFAGDWRIDRDSLLEGEFEWSSKKQASQVGFSLLGDVLPAPVDPRLNLNNQPWAQPSKFDALTGTLRYTHTLGNDWRVVGQLGSQRLKNDDFTAFPFGCSAEGRFDRFCSDGTFDYYDFRSIGEKRRENAASLELKGKVATGAITHDLGLGLLHSKVRDRLPDFAYNLSVVPDASGELVPAVGNVSGTAIVPPNPDPLLAGVNQDERSTELSLRDAIHWNARFTTWVGVRHTRLNRTVGANDGSDTTSYSQSLTTPWLAGSYKLSDSATVYASWGQGMESQIVPNNPGIYSNPGAVLPALKSRQWELGVKGSRDMWAWELAWFDIRRPMSNISFCDITFSLCTGQFDGTAVHRGVEGALQWASGPWRLGATAMLLHARREGSAVDPASNGHRPVNVPAFVARAFASWKVPGVAGMELQGSLSHEGDRAVLADQSIMLPAWTRFDAALRYEKQIGRAATTWTLGIDNVANKRYWRESPYQFGHVYLYPGAPRTVRLAVTAAM